MKKAPMAVPAKNFQIPLDVLLRRTAPLLRMGGLSLAATHGRPQLPQNRGLPSSLAPQFVQYFAIYRSPASSYICCSLLFDPKFYFPSRSWFCWERGVSKFPSRKMPVKPIPIRPHKLLHFFFWNGYRGVKVFDPPIEEISS